MLDRLGRIVLAVSLLGISTQAIADAPSEISTHYDTRRFDIDLRLQLLRSDPDGAIAKSARLAKSPSPGTNADRTHGQVQMDWKSPILNRSSRQWQTGRLPHSVNNAFGNVVPASPASNRTVGPWAPTWHPVEPPPYSNRSPNAQRPTYTQPPIVPLAMRHPIQRAPTFFRACAPMVTTQPTPTTPSEPDLTENPRIDLSLTIPHPNESDFACTPVDPVALFHNAHRESWVYDCKFPVDTQHPWVEWGRVWYGDGITPRGRNWFGSMNMVRPKFYVYGDFRTGLQSGRNALGRADNWANRLNLDLDLQVTDTERFHAFIGPLDKQNQFTRWEVIDGDLQYRNEMNLTPATAFFEGDVGAMLGALHDQSSPFELPISLGLLPLLFQNGIWMEDAVAGVAMAIPAKHCRLLNWAKFDVSFFAVFDQLNSPAFESEHDAQAFGNAWFIEAYEGYIEAGYAYLHHRNDDSLSYHNITASFTRRYFDRISNSVRVIVNAGQDRDRQARTADGGLLLFENSWITASPLTFVPYANFFYGWGRPQSVARAGISGGILRNTGINFDTDGLNGFPTLDTSAADTAGMALGVDLLGDCLEKQLLLEFSYLSPHGDRALAQGNQYGVGARYQFPISNATLLRFDLMHGWRGNEEDVYATRMEYRWKF